MALNVTTLDDLQKYFSQQILNEDPGSTPVYQDTNTGAAYAQRTSWFNSAVDYMFDKGFFMDFLKQAPPFYLNTTVPNNYALPVDFTRPNDTYKWLETLPTDPPGTPPTDITDPDYNAVTLTVSQTTTVVGGKNQLTWQMTRTPAPSIGSTLAQVTLWYFARPQPMVLPTDTVPMDYKIIAWHVMWMYDLTVNRSLAFANNDKAILDELAIAWMSRSQVKPAGSVRQLKNAQFGANRQLNDPYTSNTFYNY